MTTHVEYFTAEQDHAIFNHVFGKAPMPDFVISKAKAFKEKHGDVWLANTTQSPARYYFRLQNKSDGYIVASSRSLLTREQS